MNKKMTNLDWQHIKYMHYKTENWGDPYKVSKQLVFNVESMRKFSERPVILTCAAYSKSGHSDKSQHGKGNAADLRIKRATLLEMYIIAERHNFSGIGLYPNNGRPFIHVDVRPHNVLDKQARWIAIPTNSTSEYWEYIGLTEENIRKYVL